MMKPRKAHYQDGYKTILKQKQADHDRCDKYMTLKALIATHETSPNPDYVYIKHLEHRLRILKNQLTFSGIL